MVFIIANIGFLFRFRTPSVRQVFVHFVDFVCVCVCVTVSHKHHRLANFKINIKYASNREKENEWGRAEAQIDIMNLKNGMNRVCLMSYLNEFGFIYKSFDMHLNVIWVLDTLCVIQCKKVWFWFCFFMYTIWRMHRQFRLFGLWGNEWHIL